MAVDGRVDLVTASQTRSSGKALACVADVRYLPFRDASLDGVVAMEVMEHIREPSSLANEIARVTRADGATMVSVPTGYTERVYRRLHPRYWKTTTHEQMFSRRRLRSTLQGSGIEVVRIRSGSFEWALKWFMHALLRSDFDFTGTIYNHKRLEAWIDRALALLSRSRFGPGSTRGAGSGDREELLRLWPALRIVDRSDDTLSPAANAKGGSATANHTATPTANDDHELTLSRPT